MSRGRVVVAMSGGVDSSVAALLLAQQGYEVVGVTMRLYSVENLDAAPLNRGCCTPEDVEDARRVCQVIGARHYLLNFEREFQRHVIDYFVGEYQRGRTPHPCLACNDKIKFDFLLKRALFLEADYIATGHYARLEDRDGAFRLLQAVDPQKDQSYVLFTLTQWEMQRLLLPVGGYSKEAIRSLAREAGLPVADKPDSQEICFIPADDYRAFLEQRVTPTPGEIVDTAGRVVGQHRGIEFFTVGQRRGLGINAQEPRYVVALDAEQGRVVVGSWEELSQQSVWASRVNYITGAAPREPVEVTAKIRYKSPQATAILVPHGDWAEVHFHEPQRAVTPGQAVVFYQGDEVLGGGIIEGVGSRDACPAGDGCLICEAEASASLG